MQNTNHDSFPMETKISPKKHKFIEYLKINSRRKERNEASKKLLREAKLLLIINSLKNCSYTFTKQYIKPT